MPSVDVQQFFRVAESVQDTATPLKTTARGTVVSGEIQHNTAPQDAAASQSVGPRAAPERKESLTLLDTFWTAIKDSPLYGKAAASYVKALFDDARSNADIPLTARFVRDVQYFLNEHAHMTIHDEVLAANLIPPERMKAFMHALINGKLDMGHDRAKATERAVASFLRMTCLTPQELHLLCRPDSPEARRAAIKVGLYDLQKNAALQQMLEECMEQGQNYDQAQATVLSKLHGQMELLESLRPQTLESMIQSDKGGRLFRFMEKLIAINYVPSCYADTLMQACLRSSAEGNALHTKADIRQLLNTFQIIKQEHEANPQQADAAVRRQVLASSSQVQRGMQQYLEQTYGQQEHYTEAQRSEALHVASDVFSLANLEALNAAERSDLLQGASDPGLMRGMMQAVASMNVVVNTLLDRDAQVDEALLHKMTDLARALYDTHLVAGSRDLGISSSDLRRSFVQFCLEGKDIPAAALRPMLEKAQDRLRTLTDSLNSIATGVQSGALVSADLEQQGIFSVAGRLMDHLRTDFRALGDQLASAQNAEPDFKLEAPAAPPPAPDLAALRLAPATERRQRMENAVAQLPEAARRALDALAPAANTPYALPNAALKEMLATVQRAAPALGQVPLGNLSTVRLREALAQNLVSVLNNGDAQNLSEAEWQSRIHLGVERYVQGLADVMRIIDAQPEVDPRRAARAQFRAEHQREITYEENQALSATLPPYKAILTAAQKDVIKQALPLYGLRDADIILALANNARGNTGCADMALLLPNETNMAYAIENSAIRIVRSAFDKNACPPQDMQDAVDFLLDVSLHLHSNVGTDMPELQRRMDSAEIRSIGEQLTFLHDAFCGKDPAQPQLLAEGSSTALTATQVLESLHRISHHYTGKEVPDDPGFFLRNDSIHHVSQVNPRIYEMVGAPNSLLHLALRNANPPLDSVQYMRLAELGDRLITHENARLPVSRMLGICAHRLLKTLDETRMLPPEAELPAVWQAICGSPAAPGLTTHNFASRMLDLLNTKAVSLARNKEVAQQSDLGGQWLNYGLDPLQLLRKSGRSFTLADCASAAELETPAITSSSTSMYQLATDLPRSGKGALYTVRGDAGDRYVERGDRAYTPEEDKAHIQEVVAMANQICADNPLQSRMLLHLQTQAGASMIDFMAGFLSASGFGSEHGVTHYRAEKGNEEHVLLHIFNGPDSPVNYTKSWDISPDGTARLVRMDLARNPLYGTPLEKLPGVKLPEEPRAEPAAPVQASESEPAAPFVSSEVRRSLTAAAEVDNTLMVGQGHNTCFLASIINGMLRTAEGREALKQRFQNGMFMVDDFKPDSTRQVGHPLDAVDPDAKATVDMLFESARGQGIPREAVAATVERFSPLELALMEEYAKLDPLWHPGDMGLVQIAAPLLGFHENEELTTSIEKQSPPEGSLPSQPEDLRSENWEVMERAAASLALRGRVPILYKGTAYGNGTTAGHYMAVVGLYGEGNRDHGEFGLLVRDSISGSMQAFRLDNLHLREQYPDGGGVATDRVVLTTLVLREEELRNS